MFCSIDESSLLCAEGGLTEGTGPGLAVAGVAGPHQSTHPALIGLHQSAGQTLTDCTGQSLLGQLASS